MARFTSAGGGSTAADSLGNVTGVTPITVAAREAIIVATATGTTTLSFTGLQAGSSWTLVLKQDATGDRTVSFSGVTWPAGSPQLSRVANAVNVVSFFSPDGSTVYGFPATTAATPAVPYHGYDSSRLEAFPRMWGRDAVQWASGSILFTPFVADRDFLATNLISATRGSAAATVTTAKMGLYSVSGSTFTCIARTANDTNLWGAAATTYSRAIADSGPSGGAISSVQLYAGKTYAFAMFAVATTMPQWAGMQLATTGTAGLPALTPALSVGLGGQTDLIQSTSGTTGTIAMAWGAMT